MEIRTITDDEVGAFRESLLQTFGMDATDDPDGIDRFRALVDRAQAWAVFDGSTIAATTATFQIAIAIPGGGSLPIAGLTMVTVRPTHRRRGLLGELMRRHLDDARERGLAASGLWASEANIYGRFGYGVAAEHDAVEIRDTKRVTITARDFDDIEWIEEPRARELLPDIYARATAQRPGVLRRSDTWWQHRRFMESHWARGGASVRRHVVAKRGGQYTGYVAYRQRRGEEDITPGGKTEIVELHGVDSRAESTLWRFVLSMDLFHHAAWWSAPTDDALSLIVDDSRRIERARGDNLWLRIDDVPAALRARRYPSDGVLHFTVDGTSYELTVEDGRASCTQSAQSEIEIDRRALGSLYLGGFAATRLARAGLVRGDARAIATADRLFASAVAPWCPEIF